VPSNATFWATACKQMNLCLKYKNSEKLKLFEDMSWYMMMLLAHLCQAKSLFWLDTSKVSKHPTKSEPNS
jgi:hypothetical protein